MRPSPRGIALLVLWLLFGAGVGLLGRRGRNDEPPSLQVQDSAPPPSVALPPPPREAFPELTLTSAATVEATAPGVSDDWRMAGRDPARTRASKVTVRPPLRVRWRVDLPDGFFGRVRLADADRVYAFVGGQGRPVPLPSPEELELQMRALPKGYSGPVPTPQQFTAPPLFLVALDRRTGKLLWRTEQLPGQHFVFPWPVLAGDRVWIFDAPLSARQLVSVDKRTGAVQQHEMNADRYRRLCGEYKGKGLAVSDYCPAQPLAVSGYLVDRFQSPDVAAEEGLVECCYRLSDGGRGWDWSGAGPEAALIAPPALLALGGLLIAPAPCRNDHLMLGVWTAADGTARNTAMAWPEIYYDAIPTCTITGQCALEERGLAFLCATFKPQCGPTSDSGSIVAVDGTGRTRWHKAGPISLGVVGSDCLYCRSVAGGRRYLTALSAVNGRTLWRRRLPTGLEGAQWLSSGGVLWACSPRALSAFSAASGEAMGNRAGDFEYAEPVAAYGSLYMTETRRGSDGWPIAGSLLALAHDESKPPRR